LKVNKSIRTVSRQKAHGASMAEGFYQPKVQVDWTSSTAYSQFKMWRKEVERIISGPLATQSDTAKVSHIYIWAGAHEEMLMEAKKNENADIPLATPKDLLNALQECLTHATFFREAREEFYNLKQVSGENTTTYYSRIMDLYKQAEFPAGTDFLIVDKLIHGCTNKESKRKLMRKKKDVTVKQCLDALREDESVEASMKRLEETARISAASSVDPTKRSQRNGSKHKHHHRNGKNSRGDKPEKPKGPCKYCGSEKGHLREKCAARDATCRHCKKVGHFEKACFIKKKE